MKSKSGGRKGQIPYHVGQTPFFADAGVSECIGQLATSRHIVIFAGAGVTIDQTGMTWANLVDRLLADKDLVSPQVLPPETARMAIELIRPVEAATILKHLVLERGLPKQAVPQAMVRKLYHPGEDWNDGGLSTEVAELAHDLARCGAAVTIATTNYETLIEDKLKHVATLRADSSPVYVTAQGVKISPGRRQGIRLEYLHGRVDAEGETKGEVAVDELDYWKIQPVVIKTLAALCESTDMLIVGSSLSDLPLLAALGATRESGARRIALMPISAFEMDTSDSIMVRRATDLLRHRMGAYEVELLTPDFFSQVAQFLREVRRCLQNRAPDHAEVSRSQYFPSLRSWWEEWYERRSTDVKFAHDELTKSLELVRAELATKGHSSSTVHEILRLEAWVRWQPIKLNDQGQPEVGRRDLEFWASSASIMADESVRRRIPISLRSRYVTMKAFTAGKPLVIHLPGLSSSSDLSRDEAGFGRWLSFFAVPIHALPPGQLELTVPVGVITLSSLEDRENSRISEDVPSRMTGLLRELKAVGAKLFDVGP